MMRTKTWLRLALYSTHQKHQNNKKKKKQETFCVRPTLSKRKILTYTSLPYSTFESLKICTQHTVKGPHWAETGLQVVKFATKQKTLDIYRPATEPDRVAENTNNLQKCLINVADLSQH